MLQHLESGRGAEIDALNGALVDLARQHGVAAPFNEAIVLTVKALEGAAKQRAGPLDEPALEELARRTPRGDAWG
jgi:ketopantoate reductase